MFAPAAVGVLAKLESAPMQSIAQLVNLANQALVTFRLRSRKFVFVRHFAERISKQVQVACIAEKTPNFFELGQLWFDAFYLFEQRQLIAKVLHPFAQLVPEF